MCGDGKCLHDAHDPSDGGNLHIIMVGRLLSRQIYPVVLKGNEAVAALPL